MAVPKAWKDLAEAIEIFSKYAEGERPFHCEHDTLHVMADPAKYTKEELDRLYDLGFYVGEDDEDQFYSFRYGSA